MEALGLLEFLFVSKKEVQKPKTEFVYRSGRFGGRRVRDIKKPAPKYVYSHGRMEHPRFIFR